MPARILNGALARLDRSLRGRSAILNGFELWVGLAAISTGIVYLYDHASVDQGPVAHEIGHAASVGWMLAYTAAGLAIWYGLLRPAPLWEVIGLWLLGTATAVQAITILGLFGLHQTVPALILLALTPAAWGRALYVQRGALELAETYRRKE